MKKLALTILAAAAAFTVVPTRGGRFLPEVPSAYAEGCPDETTEQGDKKQGKFHIEYVNGKPVTVIDTIVSVCGKVPRPSVVYVLTAKNIDYEWESLKQDFLPLILATVKKAPF
jgi:hypothetical protein